METTDYKIITASSTDALENEVKAQLKKGWEPIGGFVLLPAEANENFCQTFGEAFMNALKWLDRHARPGS